MNLTRDERQTIIDALNFKAARFEQYYVQSRGVPEQARENWQTEATKCRQLAGKVGTYD